MKTIRLILAAVLLGVAGAMPAAQAADGLNTLVVLTKDHAEHQFALAEAKPEITFQGTSLLVSCAQTTATFALADVVRFTYVKTDATGITTLGDDPAGVSLEGGVIVISQLRKGATAAVYTLDGQLVRQLTARRSGTYRLSLSQLPQGVYIIKADNTTYKIARP